MTPSTAAYWAVIAICFVLIGAVLSAQNLSVEQRGTVLGGIFAALAFVGWRHRHQRGSNGEDG